MRLRKRSLRPGWSWVACTGSVGELFYAIVGLWLRAAVVSGGSDQEPLPISCGRRTGARVQGAVGARCCYKNRGASCHQPVARGAERVVVIATGPGAGRVPMTGRRFESRSVRALDGVARVVSKS